MSDCVSTQKSVNDLLAEYRANTLPAVIDNWRTLTEMEKKFYVWNIPLFLWQLHLVVNMAEHTAEALKPFESAEGSMDTESVIVRLIQTACTAFQRRGCEKSGCPLQFTT